MDINYLLCCIFFLLNFLRFLSIALSFCQYCFYCLHPARFKPVCFAFFFFFFFYRICRDVACSAYLSGFPEKVSFNRKCTRELTMVKKVMKGKPLVEILQHSARSNQQGRIITCWTGPLGGVPVAVGGEVEEVDETSKFGVYVVVVCVVCRVCVTCGMCGICVHVCMLVYVGACVCT